MTNQSKNTFEQLFNIARAMSCEVINTSDEDILIEARSDDTTKSFGMMAKNAYIRALQTVDLEEQNHSNQKTASFNLVNVLTKGMDVSLARKRIMSLSAANDPSLQLVAGRVGELTDDETLRIYQELLISGALKPEAGPNPL